MAEVAEFRDGKVLPADQLLIPMGALQLLD